MKKNDERENKWTDAVILLGRLGYEWTMKDGWVKDYSTTTVYIPPQHRATPKGNE